jgi:glycosyltransferase involved in cell wall biosynthesis
MQTLEFPTRAQSAERLTIVIPAFNEEAGIGATLIALANEPRLAGATVLVVDDGSTDNTAQIAREHGASVISARSNRGYGASLKRGVRLAETEFVAWFDADGQHRPCDLADMYQSIIEERAEAVLGARSAESHSIRRRALGKLVIHYAAESAIATRIPDVNCGLRVFRRATLNRYLHLLPNGFSASTTSTLVFLKRNHDVLFHSIVAPQRLGKSTVSQVRDGLRALHTILRILVLFNSLRTFTALAALFVTAGLAYGIPVALLHGLGFPVLGALFVVLGIQIFCLGVVCDQISALRLERLERVTEEAEAVTPEFERPREVRPRRRVA